MSTEPVEEPVTYRRWINTATRGQGSVTLTLACGHAVLRRPTFQIPRDRMVDCERCATVAEP